MLKAEEYYEEFYRLSKQPVEKRAKGLRFNRVGFWSINLLLIVVGISIPLLSYLRGISYAFFLLAALFVGWFVWGFPEAFYHEEKRRKRYLRKKYPSVYKAITSLCQQGESTLYDVPPLHIEGKTYFLASYFFRQPWWKIKPWVRLIGWIVFDEEGRVIQDTAVFGETFSTMAYADIGAVETQKRQVGELGEFRFAQRKYLPRAETLFKKRRLFFESNGLSYQWYQISKSFPLFYQAIKNAMEFYEPNNKYLEAIGYSFGYEFWYEDAVHSEKVRRVFGQYMRMAYEAEITMALLCLKEIWDASPQLNYPTKYTLDLLGRTLKQVLDITFYALNSGIPTVFEWQAYIKRLEIAKEKGFEIVKLKSAEFDPEYPYKGSWS